MKKLAQCIGTVMMMALGALAFADGVILAGDAPTGFASVDAKTPFAGADKRAVTVSTRSALLSAVSKGGLIYVDGVIDLSDAGNGSMLPTQGGGTTPALDAFVKKNSSYATYEAFKTAYVNACTTATDDGKSSEPQSKVGATMWALNHAYGDTVVVKVKSNTTIIGLTAQSGLKGGSLTIKGVSNVAVRNLTISDAYDPFPHHEKEDGFNAQHDAIHIENSTNVWIDHCTVRATLGVSHVLTGGKTDEKWQTYDGLCDITGKSKNVTVSYTRLEGNDKTMLIGSSDSEAVSGRTVTLHHNYFYNCGQRLPMVRLTDIHVYNNYYLSDSAATVKQNYALGVRYNANVYAEANYFDKGINYSVSGTSGKQGNLYSTGDVDNSAKKRRTGQFKELKSAPFTPPYTYTAESAEQAKETVLANAGAGVWSVQQ